MSAPAVDGRRYRIVQTDVLCTLDGNTSAAATSTPATCKATVRGLSSLLSVGVFVHYVPSSGGMQVFVPGTDVFNVYGLFQDAWKDSARLAVDPINGTQDFPGGWEGVTNLEGYEIEATVATVDAGKTGQLRISLVVQPADCGISDRCWDELLRSISLVVNTRGLLTRP